MSNETTDNFWAAFAETPDIKPLKIFYRLYYDDHGNPLFYSMEDLPGKYIEIDQATFSLSPTNIRIVDEKLTYLKTPTALRLHPSDKGTPCHIQNVSVVVDESQPHKKWILK